MPISISVPIRISVPISISLSPCKHFKNNTRGKILIKFPLIGDVKFNHLSRTYVMHTSVHIMSIIVLFNNVDTMTFAEVSMTTGIGQDDLLRYLQLLVDNDIMLCDVSRYFERDTCFGDVCVIVIMVDR